MTPIEKLAALTALCGGRGTYGASIIYSDITNKVYVSAPIEISNGHFRGTVVEHKDSFEQAIDSYWNRIVSITPLEHLRVARSEGEARRVVWNGFMWKDVRVP